MKFALLGFLLLGISNIALCEENLEPIHENARLQGVPEIISDIIKSLLETVTGAIPDPVSISQVNISLPYEGIAYGVYSISDFLEIGAKNLEIVDVATNVLRSTLNIIVNIPSININTNYYADLLFGSIVPMYGEGPMNIRLKNLKFNLTAKYILNVLKLRLQIKDTSFITTLDEATFDIHGMINNEAFSILCSQILDDTFSVFINEHTELISEIASPIVQKVANSIMSGGKKSTLHSADIDFEKMIKKDDIRELGKLFVKALMSHPKLAQIVNF